MRIRTLWAALIVVIGLPGGLFAQGCLGGGSDEEGVQIAGFFQPQIEYKLQDGEDEFSFTMHRARVAFYGTAPYDVEYYLCMEFSPFHGNPGVLDGFITYTRLGPYAKLSLGQFKAPFSLEQNTSCAGLHTIKRSMVVNNLAGPIRDLGLMLAGTHEDLVSYSVAMINGKGAGVEDDSKSKDYVGRVVVSPVPYLSVGGSYRYGKSPAAATGVEEEDERTRYGAELEVAYEDFLFQGEYIAGEDKGSYTTGGGCGGPVEVHQGSVDRYGYFFQALYMTPWNLQPVFKYELWEPDEDTDDDQIDVLTFGANYWVNEWTRLQFNYLYICEECEIWNDEMVMQVQVKF